MNDLAVTVTVKAKELVADLIQKLEEKDLSEEFDSDLSRMLDGIYCYIQSYGSVDAFMQSVVLSATKGIPLNSPDLVAAIHGATKEMAEEMIAKQKSIERLGMLSAATNGYNKN